MILKISPRIICHLFIFCQQNVNFLLEIFVLQIHPLMSNTHDITHHNIYYPTLLSFFLHQLTKQKTLFWFRTEWSFHQFNIIWTKTHGNIRRNRDVALYLCMTHYYVIRIAPWVILSILCSKETAVLGIVMISSIKNGEVVKLYVTQCLHKMKNKTIITLSEQFQCGKLWKKNILPLFTIKHR